MTENEQVLLSAKEAAEILGEDPRSVQRKAKAGTLPFVAKLPGAKGAYVFDQATIAALAAGDAESAPVPVEKTVEGTTVITSRDANESAVLPHVGPALAAADDVE